ncbi:hypothetical protein EDB87DRAFT_991897 [Lactarius vividus]|nr:hypothetical protein EDB87DRAFT_991897 [Lactarius vividus]
MSSSNQLSQGGPVDGFRIKWIGGALLRSSVCSRTSQKEYRIFFFFFVVLNSLSVDSSCPTIVGRQSTSRKSFGPVPRAGHRVLSVFGPTAMGFLGRGVPYLWKNRLAENHRSYASYC